MMNAERGKMKGKIEGIGKICTKERERLTKILSEEEMPTGFQRSG